MGYYLPEVICDSIIVITRAYNQMPPFSFFLTVPTLIVACVFGISCYYDHVLFKYGYIEHAKQVKRGVLKDLIILYLQNLMSAILMGLFLCIHPMLSVFSLFLSLVPLTFIRIWSHYLAWKLVDLSSSTISIGSTLTVLNIFLKERASKSYILSKIDVEQRSKSFKVMYFDSIDALKSTVFSSYLSGSYLVKNRGWPGFYTLSSKVRADHLRSPLPFKFNYYKEHFLLVYYFVKTTIVALAFAFCFFLFSVFFLQIQFLKQVAIWFVVGMLFFWLISGFNFFLKRYRFGKFTSQIQRFWKRTTIYFWLIEGFLILIYFYYFMNSSQEPTFMYDYSSLNQEYLIPLNVVFVNIILLSMTIYLIYFVLLRLNNLNFRQLLCLLLLPTLLLLYSFFIETYQFIYVLTSFRDDSLVFLEEENLWTNMLDDPIIRVKQQYLLICLIAKYWHFLFIFISWIFFCIKSFEKKSVSYTLLGYNAQNIVILFFLNLLCYVQWLKWIYRRFFDIPYSDFFVTYNNNFIYNLSQEILLNISAFFNVSLAIAYISNIYFKAQTFWEIDNLSMWKLM